MSAALPGVRGSFPGRWRKRIAGLLIGLTVIGGAAYAIRCVLLQNIARIALNHDAELVAQEKADAVAVGFAKPPPAWITPMKNNMNDIWEPVKSRGVNYFMFAGPRHCFKSYSERSNPTSPYYQAWVGGYVIKRNDGSLPEDLQALAWQVTTLDQRSWLSAMGDPKPVADPSPATRVGNIIIDGHPLPLWHGTMRSHSDISSHPEGPLPTLIGMPRRATWPAGVDAFHDVTLDGYFTGWVVKTAKLEVVQ